MPNKAILSSAEVHLDTLNLVKQSGGQIMPDLYTVTATINKVGKPDDRAVAALISSHFPEVAEAFLTAFKFYYENRPELEAKIDEFNARKDLA